jgi:tRNA(adenine34) deaminase
MGFEDIVCRNDDERFMLEAMREAELAAGADEVPVGAVIVKGVEVIARAHNLVETSSRSAAHAEMLAIEAAESALGAKWLPETTLYVTLEPCSMCAGAIVWSRIEKLYIGTMDPKAGACGSLMNIPQDSRLNHYVEIETGLMREECAGLMKDFFRKLRTEE